MQQLIPAITVDHQHQCLQIQHQFSESQIDALFARCVTELQCQPTSLEQGADWLALSFYYQEELCWLRYEALAGSLWAECANSAHFQALCEKLKKDLGLIIFQGQENKM
ncbi:DUF3630 family protein [Aliagarivorans taiwanensis]|uniref:DUF3630 family protein n=1 Tax=Aliagarivorans taiwanensis TaxID=561966 RepID=UPI0004236233|nr:DUF3630 family protein [Aliagarivorans taiwanensis]